MALTCLQDATAAIAEEETKKVIVAARAAETQATKEGLVESAEAAAKRERKRLALAAATAVYKSIKRKRPDFAEALHKALCLPCFVMLLLILSCS